MKIAISPCPNDTYLFHAWIQGLVGKDLPIEIAFADIQLLNEWAFTADFPLIKISFHCFAQVAQTYQLLPIGSALGFNCGPKLIAKFPFALEELPQKTVAIPGKDTTAHLLLSRLLPKPKAKRFCLYHEIANLIEKNEADCGLIIHESRFTFAQAGFIEIADLGEMWHAQCKAPLPLGGLAIKRTLSNSKKRSVVKILQQSLEFAKKHPDICFSFIQHHAQEKNPDVILKHITTYVNHETQNLSSDGMQAIQTLLNCALPQDWLYSLHGT